MIATKKTAPRRHARFFSLMGSPLCPNSAISGDDWSKIAASARRPWQRPAVGELEGLRGGTRHLAATVEHRPSADCDIVAHCNPGPIGPRISMRHDIAIRGETVFDGGGKMT